MSNVHDLPEHIDLDLDAYERPASEVKPPFRTKVNGRVVSMNDPSELDWRDLLLLENPLEFIRLTMSSEDRRHVTSNPLPAHKFNRLMEGFYAHFELEEKVASARRQQQLQGL